MEIRREIQLVNLEPIKRAHAPELAAGLASVYKMSHIPYGRREALASGRTFPAACCRVFKNREKVGEIRAKRNAPTPELT